MKYKSHKAALIGTVKELSEKTATYGPIDLSGANNPDEMSPDDCADYIIRLHAVYTDALNALEKENEMLRNSPKNNIRIDGFSFRLTQAKEDFIKFLERRKNHGKV